MSDPTNFNDYFKPAPRRRPMFNTGCLMDIPTGQFVLGKRGESILHGGVSYVTGICGMGNMFKSVLGLFLMLMILNRYSSARGMQYDTEVSATIARILMLARRMDNICDEDLEALGRIFLSDKTVMSGDEFWEQIKRLGEDKQAAAKRLKLSLIHI